MGARRLDEIDWVGWRATDPATLVFAVRDDSILLIHKKRGLGAGKINGPGGRLERGESLLDCAIREVREELGVTPLGLCKLGENRFQFVDGYSIHVHVFRARDVAGEPIETDEAIPLWVPLDRIPYERMWFDDRFWLPLVLENRRFSGRFLFDGDHMLDYELEVDGP